MKAGIETERAPWVQALVAAGYEVFPVNPMSVARYRERHSTSGAKSDAANAHLLAEIVRLDRAHHRPVAGDSPLAEAVKLAARAHQSLIWDRSRHVLRLRAAPRRFARVSAAPPGRPSRSRASCADRSCGSRRRSTLPTPSSSPHRWR